MAWTPQKGRGNSWIRAGWHDPPHGAATAAIDLAHMSELSGPSNALGMLRVPLWKHESYAMLVTPAWVGVYSGYTPHDGCSFCAYVAQRIVV